MLINETVVGDAIALIDEQDKIGNPAAGKGIRPESPYFPGWQKWQYPIHITLDLGAMHRLDSFFVFNETGQNELTLSTGKPFAWKNQLVTLPGYRTWHEVKLNSDSRYLRLTLAKPTSLPEIALYGSIITPSTPIVNRQPSTPTKASNQVPTMDQFIGINGFIDDPLDKMAECAGFLREYHSWGWDVEAPDHQVRFQPSGAAGGNLWFFDDYYRKLKTLGVTVSPAIQGTNQSLFNVKESDWKPVKTGDDSENPASYLSHATHLFQFAARYGEKKVADSELKIATGQPRISGAGSLKFIENWNEPDKSWKGREGYFSPYDLAAMCSADYDGNQGKMGRGVGVKSADPKLKLVLGGLAGLNLDFIKAMKFWSDHNRGGSFPADVLNFHHYSSDGTSE